jgi:AraC family L-rhamnose operon transcriptional activator RhaR
MHWAELSFTQLEKEWYAQSRRTGFYDLMRIAFETALLLFQRNRTEVPAGESMADRTVIQKVLQEIHAAYNTPITIGEIAARHFLSESSLRKKFSELFGMSPKQYLIHLRLEEAKRLLQQTGKAIEAISADVGFTSSSRFCDLFVRSVGLTPLEWRKQNQTH